MKRNRLAAIDIGTNSIRCIVVEAGPDGKFRVLDDEKVTVRLGEGFAKNGSISAAAWQRALDALSRMKKIVDSFGVVRVETVATSVIVVDELMELFRANLLKINERGIREGLILNGLKKLNLQ